MNINTLKKLKEVAGSDWKIAQVLYKLSPVVGWDYAEKAQFRRHTEGAANGETLKREFQEARRQENEAPRQHQVA